MKHIFRIILLVVLITIVSAISFALFFIFIKDPFIKFAPENTYIYTSINLNQHTNKNINNENIFNLKNIEINKILENKEFEKIKKYYKSNVSLFLTRDNNFYIILKEKNFKKNIEEINVKNISDEISKYTNFNLDLKYKKINNYLFITNNESTIDGLISSQYKFFIKNTEKLFNEKEFSFLLDSSLMKTYLETNSSNNIFTKDYSLVRGNIKESVIDIAISNINNERSVLNNYYINNINNNYIELNNVNLFNFANSIFENYKTKDIQSAENINYFLKNIQEEGAGMDSLKNILSNNGKVFVELNDSNIKINNIKNFIVLVEAHDLSKYVEDIKNIENMFLRKLALDNPKIERVTLEDGTKAKEERIDYSNLHFNLRNINNGIVGQANVIKLKDYSFYYSIIEKDGLILFSNSEDFINNLSNNESSNYLFRLKNINFDISSTFDENMINIRIK